MEPKDVLLLWPNVVCYIRALLGTIALGLAWFPKAPEPTAVCLVYVFSMSLDFLDGYLARRLQQQTKFGAALDVVVDVAQRGGMWIVACDLPGLIFPLLELLVFAFTHSSGNSWKDGCFADAPMLVASIMSNGFKTPCGVLTVAGLHFLPLYLWLLRLPSVRIPGFIILGVLLCFGRLLGLVLLLLLDMLGPAAALERWSSCLLAPSGIQFFRNDSSLAKTIHVDISRTYIYNGMDFSRTMSRIERQMRCDSVVTSTSGMPGWLLQRLSGAMDFWSQRLRGETAGVNLEMLQHASRGWTLPFQVFQVQEPLVPRHWSLNTSSSGKPSLTREMQMVTYFNAFLPSHGTKNCGERVRHAAGSRARFVLGPAFHALLVETVRMVCLIEERGYHLLAKNKKSLLIVADNSLQWLQYLLRMRWQCPELSFLGLDSVKLTWRKQRAQLDLDVQAFRSALRQRGLRWHQRFHSIFLLPLGVMQQSSSPHPSLALLPVMQEWLLNDFPQNRSGHKSLIGELVFAFLAHKSREDRLLVEATGSGPSCFRHITGVMDRSMVKSWTVYHLQDRWKLRDLLHRPYLGNWSLNAAHIWGCPSCALSSRASASLGPALGRLSAVEYRRSARGQDYQFSNFTLNLHKSLDISRAVSYTNVTVLMAYPYSGSRTVTLMMEAISGKPVYSLYNLWYLRSGWCKFVQPFGLLSHVDCTDEPSVVRHHSMEFSASVHPDLAYGYVLILCDYGDHLAGMSLLTEGVDVEEFLQQYISIVVFYDRWLERKLLIFYDHLVKKPARVGKQLSWYWRMNATWWTPTYQRVLEEKMSQLPSLNDRTIFGEQRRSAKTKKAEVRWTEPVLAHIRAFESLACKLYPRAFNDYLYHPEWKWGSGSATSCFLAPDAPKKTNAAELPGEKKAVTMSKPAKLPSTSAQGAAGFARAEDGAATSEAPGRAQFSSFSMEELPQMDLTCLGDVGTMSLPGDWTTCGNKGLPLQQRRRQFRRDSEPLVLEKFEGPVKQEVFALLSSSLPDPESYRHRTLARDASGRA